MPTKSKIQALKVRSCKHLILAQPTFIIIFDTANVEYEIWFSSRQYKHAQPSLPFTLFINIICYDE